VTELHIDLNADVGEGEMPKVFAGLIGVVTSVNIACGGHTGDENTMRQTGAAARAAGIRVGAHPSYPDRANFGRVTVTLASERLRASILEQVRSLAQVTEVGYLKPHGALYNDAVRDPRVADVVYEVAAELTLPVMLLSGSRPGTIIEGFIDRAYMPDGSLKSRELPGALILDPFAAASQALALAPAVDSLCVHADTPGAVELMSAARNALEQAGYTIGP
jgi:UPF0271 protein